MKNVLRIRVLIIFLLSSLLLFSIYLVELQHSQNEVNYRNKIESLAQRELLMMRSILEADVYLDIFYANSLATILSVSPEMPKKQWQQIAQELYRKSSHLKNIAVAPNDVVEFVYPLEGNKAVLGLDYRTVPEQWKTVTKARVQESIFIAGPIKLVQGGVGLIVRTPVFSDPPYNNEYWGVGSIVIDLESLFKEAGIYEISQEYNFAIRGKDGKGTLGEVIWGDSAVFESTYVHDTVVLPSGTWEIAISLPSLYEAIPFFQHYISRLIGYSLMLLSIIIFAGVYYLYHKAHDHSMRDELTLLPNRRYFIYSLEQMIDSCQKIGSSFVLLNIDVDEFKSVNDTYGHVIGDKLLIEIARRLKSTLRSSDIVARTGGDEFLIILPRMSQEEELQHTIATIGKSISEKPIKINDTRIYAKVSIGYAIYANEDVTVDELMATADISMYENKKSK